MQRDPGERLQTFEWRGEAFHFAGSTTARQLKISYQTSGNPPASGSVGIDGSKPFLSTYTAYLACGPYDRLSESGRLYELCFGTRQEPGGLLHRLILPMVKALQRTPRSRRPFTLYPGVGGRRRAPYYQA